MKLLADIRSLFSRYELAAAGQVLHLLFVAAGVAVLVTRGSTGGLVFGFVLALFLGFGSAVLSLCPTCGKSPFTFRLIDEPRGFQWLLFVGRWWPERECSSCGTRLDVI